MGWEFDSSRPIYLQLVDTLRLRIISGKDQPGERLPSVRELAADAGVNPNTMQRALSELEHEGLVFTQRTSGRFITTDRAVLESAKQSAAREITASWLSQLKELGLTGKDAYTYALQAMEHKEE